MERIDQLENDILGLQNLIVKIQKNRKKEDIIIGQSQNLRDKEIIEYIGEKSKEDSN